MAHIFSQFFNIERSSSWPAYFAYVAAESAALSCHQTTIEGKKPENRALNRYRDVLPFDNSLIRLEGKPSYINANLVCYEPAKRSYILTQGPLPNTVSHFWRMVWQQNCSSIIMLNKIIEKGRPKCSPYFPAECSPKEIVYDGLTNADTAMLHLEDAEMTVHLESEIHYESFVKRNLLLTKTDTGETRGLCHFNYVDWPDFGEPSCPKSFLCFLSLLRESKVFESVPVIHCSAGIGRSGTFIFVDIILALLAMADLEVTAIEPSEILLCLRGQRCGLIQTPDQLRFCYLAVLHAFADPKLKICHKWTNELIDQIVLVSEETKLLYGRQLGHISAASDSKSAAEEGPIDCFLQAERLQSYDSNQPQPCSAEEEQEIVCKEVLDYVVESCSNPKEYRAPIGEHLVMHATVLGGQLTSFELTCHQNYTDEDELDLNENEHHRLVDDFNDFLQRSSSLSSSSMSSDSTTT